MPAATTVSNPLFVELVTTAPGSDGDIVRISASREGKDGFDRLVRGPRLTLGQAQFTGLTNTQLDTGSDLEVVLEDLLEFGSGADVWIVPHGVAARDLFRMAARSAGFPRYPGVPLIGIDELAAVVRPTGRGMGVPPMSRAVEQKPVFEMRRGAHLPHWTQTDAVYSVNFRLADSLPQEVIREWEAEHNFLKTTKPSDSPDYSERARALREKIEQTLDTAYGECLLKDERIASLVSNALQHFDGTRYRLFAWCLMPNHVHAVLQPTGEYSLSQIMHSWKSFTAKEANKILGRSGDFWQDESYDHLVRNEKDLHRCIEYVYLNPEKAGLEDWKWRGAVGIDDIKAGIADATQNADPHGPEAHATNRLRLAWTDLKSDLLKLPLPLLSEMNWLLARTDHPLKGLLKAAEGEAVNDQFTDTFRSGKLSLERLFKDYSEIIDLLAPEEDAAGMMAGDEPPTEPVAAEEIAQMLGPDGPLAKNLQGYEQRPEQIEMAQRAGEALTDGKHLMAEAGTGIGKSLAYLVPAIVFARRAGRPVMISTHTKNLQSQLYEKDLPFLRKHLGIDFESALLKGRPNYLCLRKFTYTLQESASELDDEERGALLPVMTWATQTETGDVTELAAFSREQSPELWDRLHTVGDDCLKRQCPFYKRCFVYKARGLTRSADVVVLNHALVFSDLNVESGVLPPYNEIVFDEGHKLEDVATEHLSCEVTPRRTYRILNRLFKTSQGSAAGKGLLPALLNGIELARSEFPEPLFTSIKEHILAAIQEIDPANQGSEDFFNTVREWTDEPESQGPEPGPGGMFVPVERGRGGAIMPRDDFGQPQKQPFQFNRRKPRQFMSDRRRFSAQTLRPDETERFTQGKESAIARLGRLRQALEKLEEDFKEIRKRTVPRAREVLKELEAQNLFLEELIGDIEFVIRGDEPNYVYWCEPLGKRGARVIAAPLDVSALLHSQLYEKKRSIVITSATLSVRDAEADEASGLAPLRGMGVSPMSRARATTVQSGDEETHGSEAHATKPHPKSFEFLKNRLGLNLCDKEKLDELLLGSPFDYDKQCRLYIPTFIPEPGGAREKDFTAAFTDMLSEVIAASGGRAMVLYTSYSALEASATILRKTLTPQGIEVIAQGSDGSRESLLARLKEGGRTALLGTASFWEGVDVRGDALSLLVIAKLPFAVFTDPVIQGRCELLEASGKDPFLHFSVPQAILKLRQGFGRLIRSKSDRGVVILGDKRVLTKRYGAAFLRALPAQAHAISNCNALADEVREFLK